MKFLYFFLIIKLVNSLCNECIYNTENFCKKIIDNRKFKITNNHRSICKGNQCNIIKNNKYMKIDQAFKICKGNYYESNNLELINKINEFTNFIKND